MEPPRISFSDFDPFPSTLDQILAEIAFSLQLPPSLHEKATSRYKAVREFLEDTQEFKDLIEHFYPQGSMAIDATISTRGTDDEYDIDIVAQLGGRYRSLSACEILDALYDALKDYRGLKVTRQTRCVTIHYADGMHLDITPSLRHYGTNERQSEIAHSKGPAKRSDDCFVAMNAFGFASWYADRTPEERQVIEAFKRHWKDDNIRFRADADVDEVPQQTSFAVKNTATLALQLLKRYRNIVYQDHQGRIPPSVMLSCFAGHAAWPNTPLCDMLIRLCGLISEEIRAATARARLLDVPNPSFGEDKFTDRWPEKIQQQDFLADRVEALAIGLQRAKKGQIPAWQLNDWLREQFGDLVVTKAAKELAKRTGDAVQASKQTYRPSGSLILPTAIGATTSTASKASVPAVNHTFYGKKI